MFKLIFKYEPNHARRISKIRDKTPVLIWNFCRDEWNPYK